MSAPKKSSHPKTEANELRIGLALRGHPGLHAGKLFRLDTFSGRIMLMHPVSPPGVDQPQIWQAVERRPRTDVDVTRLMVWLQHHNFQKVTTGRVTRAIDLEAERNAFSSAREALDAIPVWDNTPRLDRFWIDVCGVEVAEDGMDEQEVFQRLRYLHATARCFFIGIVARIMQPGCKNDVMVILEGEQGTLKSTLLRKLCLQPEWFSDNMPHDVSTKDAKQHLGGKLIIEMGELNQFSRSKAGILKDFLSMLEDEFRPPYGRDPVLRPRQCVFVGTTNCGSYFTDETGNRRFWPIICGDINLNLAEQLRDQLYAEALVAFRAGEQWWLPADVEVMAEIEQDKRLVDDPWASGVATVVETARAAAKGAGQTVFYVTSVQGLAAVETDVARWDYTKQLRVALILRKLGGKNMRLPRQGGEQKRGFRFIIGTNGAGEASHTSQPGSGKPLN